MKKKYTKKQITEAIAYWKKVLNEGTSIYDDNTFAALDDFKPMLDKFVGFSKDAMTASGKGVNYWNEVMWLMFALANYVEKECPAEDSKICADYVELAKQINSVGRQKMQ